MENYNYNYSPVIITSKEAVLYEDTQIILKNSEDLEDERKIKGSITVTSKKLSFKFLNNKNEQIINLPYPNITYHAINKEMAYIMLQLNLNEDIEISNFGFEIINKDDKLFIFTKDKIEAINLFDNITTGSSLNPEFQNEENEININYDENQNYCEEEDYEEINNKENINQNDDDTLPEDEYESYNYTNTIDKLIFQTQKTKKNLSDYDPRRFEDADMD